MFRKKENDQTYSYLDGECKYYISIYFEGKGF